MFPATDTFSTLIDEVQLALTGYGLNQDQVTALAAPISSADLTLQLSDADIVYRGVCEVGNEMVYVKEVSAGIATLYPWGRGHQSTTAESHAAGEKITYSPTWPRSVIGRAINDTISDVYPWVFAVGTTELQPSSTVCQLGLTDQLVRVLGVEQRSPYLTEWTKVDTWGVSFNANTADYPTGVSITLPTIDYLGTLRVWYAYRPVPFAALADAFTTTGLPTSCKSLVVLGACARLVGWLDIGRLPVLSVESSELAPNRPLGSAMQAAREIRTQFQARLMEEQKALETKFPPRIHKGVS